MCIGHGPLSEQIANLAIRHAAKAYTNVVFVARNSEVPENSTATKRRSEARSRAARPTSLNRPVVDSGGRRYPELGTFDTWANNASVSTSG